MFAEIKVKIGPDEFHGTGSEETLLKALAMFIGDAVPESAKPALEKADSDDVPSRPAKDGRERISDIAFDVLSACASDMNIWDLAKEVATRKYGHTNELRRTKASVQQAMYTDDRFERGSGKGRWRLRQKTVTIPLQAASSA